MTKPSEAPDGGWGWVIVVVVFFLTLLCFGTTYSIGIIFDALIEEFGCTKSEVSIIASIAFSLQCFLGPVVSLLQQKYHVKKVVLVGCLLISIAFIASYFAPNVIYLYFTIGVIGGIGMAMVYLPLIVLISFYFHRRRSLATALACLGGHVGSFVHPHLIRLLMSYYDWRGALLIMGALVLNSLALSILLRPVNYKRHHHHHITQEETGKSEQKPVGAIGNEQDASQTFEAFISDNIAGCNADEAKGDQEKRPHSPCEFNSDARLIIAEAGDEFEVHTPIVIAGTPRLNFQCEGSVSSTSSLPKLKGSLPRPRSFARQLSERIETSLLAAAPSSRRRQTSVPALDKKFPNDIGAVTSPVTPVGDGNYLKVPNTFPKKNLSRRTSYTSYNSAVNSSILSIPIFDASLAPEALFSGFADETSSSLPISRVQSNRQCNLCDGVLQTAPVVVEKTFCEKATSTTQLSTPLTNNKTVTAVTTETTATSTTSDSRKSGVFAAIKPFFRHFGNAGFTAFVASNFLLCLVYYTPSVFIAHWGKELGISKERTTILLSLIGLGNIIGRPLLALSADKWSHYRIPLFALMIGIAGAVTTITPLLTNFYFLAFSLFQFGFLAGTSQTLLTPILADMVPLSELSHAFGVLILADGIAMLIGPPVLAILPSYDLTFAISGLIMISSSVVLIGPIYVRRLLHARSVKKTLKANGSFCTCNQLSQSVGEPSTIKPENNSTNA